MSIPLYRHLPPVPLSAAPGVPAPAGWPSTAAYNGTQTFSGFGADVNNQYIAVVAGAITQWTISNTINQKKYSSLFVYELDSAGNFVGSPTTVAGLNYDYNLTSWTRFVAVGLNPASTRTFAVAKQNGTDTQGTTGTWSHTTTPAVGAVIYWNGSSYNSVSSGAGWQQDPVWNSAGTYIAGATTPGTGPSSNGIIALSGWSGTAVTSTATYTVPGPYINDVIWVNDFLIVATAFQAYHVYQRFGSTLTFRSSITHTALGATAGYTHLSLGSSQPDEANNRFFAPTMAATDSSASTNTNLAGMAVNVDGSGNLTVTPIIGGANPSNGTTARWANFPVKGNKLINVSGTSKGTEAFATNPSGASQVTFNAASIPSGTRMIVKQHAISGSVVSVQQGSATVYKIS